MQETDLNAKLAKSFPEYFNEAFASKIHGSMYNPGFPDIYACVMGMAVHIECKMGKIPGRETTPFIRYNAFSDKQIDKMTKLSAAGALVLAGIYIHQKGHKYCVLIKFNSPEWQLLKENKLSFNALPYNASDFTAFYKRQMYDLTIPFNYYFVPHCQKIRHQIEVQVNEK